MSHQTKVQGYLHKYNLTHLFEVMMSSLVKEMPADPYEYLISMISRQKQKVARKTSATESGEVKDSATHIWSSTGEKNYEKPWRNNSKSGRPSKTGLSSSMQDWDSTVKLTSKSFDELNLSGKPSTKLAGGRNSEKSNLFPTGSPSSSTSHLEVTEEEFLSEETLTISQPMENTDASTTADVDIRTHPKLKGPKADSLKHQAELAEYIAAKKAKAAPATETDSGVVDVDNEEDFAAGVVYENPADLLDEGVEVKGTEASVGQMKSSRAFSEPLLQVSICAQCAKVISDKSSQVSSTASTSLSFAASHASGRASQKVSSANKWQKSDRHKLNAKAVGSKGAGSEMGGFDSAHPPTGRTGFSSYYAAGDEDDDFESVSQVSGEKPRMPVWVDSDDEQITPVKGSHMLTSPRQSKSSRPGSRAKGMSSTLKEDMLRQLPRSANTVEEFLGKNSTWSRERINSSRQSSQTSQPDAAHPNRHPRNSDRQLKDQVQHSYDSLGANGSRGWNLDYNEDGSTLVD